MEAHKSTRTRIGKTQPRDHEDHVAEKGFNSLSHCNLVHKRIPLLLALRIPDAKAAVARELEKLERFPAWQVTKVKSKKEIIEKARNEVRTVHFSTLMGLCHLKNSKLERRFQKYTVVR